MTRTPDPPEYVFTGKLKSMTRTEAFAAVEKIGGTAKNHVTRNTQYLVLGDVKNAPSRKFSLAGRYSEQGFNVQVIDEDEFLKKLQGADIKLPLQLSWFFDGDEISW